MSKKKTSRERVKKYAESIGFNQVAHARRVLMKILMFNYAKRLGLANCYRCKKELELSDFTIDHIEGWRNKSNAKELFFDVDNIRFSHHSCNSANTSIEKKPKRHGHSLYTKGCRCDICTEGHRKRIAKSRKKNLT